jgi:hypothetical protein
MSLDLNQSNGWNGPPLTVPAARDMVMLENDGNGKI